MKRAAERLNPDFTVLLGMELRHYGTANDYLIYGVNEDFIYAAGNLMKPWEKKVYDMCHKNGFLVFQAHPFRAGIRQCDERYIDGIEIYNGKPRKHLTKKLKRGQSEAVSLCVQVRTFIQRRILHAAVLLPKCLSSQIPIC